MKRMAFVLAVFAMAGCKKGEQPSSAASVPDTSSQVTSSDPSRPLRSSDTSRLVMSDTSSKMLAHPKSLLAESTSVAQGAIVFEKKGCPACHNIAKSGEEPHRRPGGKQSGPDLAGVTERRDRGWLRRWLNDPDAMLASDPTAKAMLREAKHLKMPNMKLSDSEIEALINYLAVKQ